MTALSPKMQALIDALVVREGGYVNDPDDAGGPTKYGITLAALHEWRRAAVTASDVEALDKAEAAQIYAQRYFFKPGFDQVRESTLQEFLFDFAVNSGPGAAVRGLQAALKDAGLYAGEIDGDFGPKTAGALAAVTNHAALFYATKCQRYELMMRYIGAKPVNAKFAAGWANRLDEFQERF